jgi:D-alanyl-D-alanine carboxypeptidase
MTSSSISSVMGRMSDRILQLMQQHGIPGVSIAVVHDQEVTWAKGFGFADLASARPMHEETLFGVASITKTFTAGAIMQLRDEGKLSLADSVIRYVPEFNAVKSRFCPIDQITIRRLMTHRSGLVGEGPTGHWRTLEFPSIADILDYLRQVEIVIEPDSAFKYCNLAFAILGEIVARVSGTPCREYILKHILVPLEMTSSGFERTPESRQRTATGYMAHRYDDAPDISPDPELRGYDAAGGLRSSVLDLAKWVSLQFRTEAKERADAQVVSEKSLREMHRVTDLEPDWRIGYAMPWFANRLGDNIYLQHSGSVPGFLSLLVFSKRDRVGVIALSNVQGQIGIGEIAFETIEELVKEIRQRARKPEAPAPTPEECRPLLGRYYSSPLWGVVVHVEFRNNQLLLVIPTDPFMLPTPPATLKPTGATGEFIVQEGRVAGEPLRFQFGPDGTVTGFILGEGGSEYTRRS